MVRKLFAELVGTATLVFVAVGVATLMFGFKLDGGSVAAGIVATALAFGLTIVGLAYAIGPISGCHVNPAVTLGALIEGRISRHDAVGYWVAQFVGGYLGALGLWAVVAATPGYSRSGQGLGTDGYGASSLVHLGAGGAFAVEVVLTAIFVFVILVVTGPAGRPALAGVVIGLTLTLVHLMGIGLTGTSVNPARSLGPALVVGGTALSQVWLFLVAPFVGAVVAALVHRALFPSTNAGTAVPTSAE